MRSKTALDEKPVKPALPWLKHWLAKEREPRQWVKVDAAKKRRDKERELRERVLDFKAEMQAAGIGFKIDRDAWEAFIARPENDGVWMEFAGNSADRAIMEWAFHRFKEIYKSGRHKKVRFQGVTGNRTFHNAPTLFRLGPDDIVARTDPIEVLRLSDQQQRTEVVASIRAERERQEKIKQSYQDNIDYLDAVIEAADNGLVAIPNPMTGELVVQALLPGQTVEEVYQTAMMEVSSGDNAE